MLTARRKADPTGSGSAVSGAPAAILVPCSRRKSELTSRGAQAISLPCDSQGRVETTWLCTLAGLTYTTRAEDLYRGRGFRLALELAAECGSYLYIVSAGLGLVRADAPIPTYGMALSGAGPENISARVKGRFCPSAWWQAIACGPFATPLNAMFDTRREGLIVASLSHPYARLIGSALADARPRDLARLRIVGSRLRDVLPKALRPYIMPYDDRLTERVPGARVDLAQRALTHFVRECLAEIPDADAAGHANWVAAALGRTTAPTKPVRRRCTDDAVLEIIHRHLDTGLGAARLLRMLRDQEGMACEQTRFVRLYRLATARRAA